MKKFLGALFLSVTLAKSAFAVTTIPWTKAGCESVNGTWVTAYNQSDTGCDANHCNGMNFCRSNVRLNWWSALIWCKSIGRQLADLETACPHAISSGTICKNLYGRVGVDFWMSTPASSTTAYIAGMSGRDPKPWGRENSGNTGVALCTE